MSELNDVSQAIGGLQSDVKNLGGGIEHLITYVKENNAAMQAKLTKHDTDIEELQTFRGKCYGIAAVVALVSTTVGQYLTKKLT